jgi:hypothetical protein
VLGLKRTGATVAVQKFGGSLESPFSALTPRRNHDVVTIATNKRGDRSDRRPRCSPEAVRIDAHRGVSAPMTKGQKSPPQVDFVGWFEPSRLRGRRAQCHSASMRSDAVIDEAMSRRVDSTARV